MSGNYFSSKSLLLVTIILQILISIALFFEIPILRQVIGFFYLTFIPGLTLLKALKIKLHSAEMIFLSSSLSLALLLIIGLSINLVYPALNVSNPLSTNSLFITLTLFLLPINIFNFLRENKGTFISSSSVGLNLSFSVLLLFFFFALAGAVGIFLVNIYGNNLILLFVVAIIPICIICAFKYKKIQNSDFYSIFVMVICVSLLAFVNSSLITNNVVGWDAHSEYYVFQVVEKDELWLLNYPFGSDSVQKGFASLSVTILPTMYSKILNFDGSWFFKFFYPMVASFVVMGTFLLFNTQFEKKWAFLASFFFLTVSMSYGWGSNKQIVAQLFYIALFFVFFQKNFNSLGKGVFLSVFAFALIVSHYSLAYIFLFSTLLVFLALHFFKKSASKLNISFVLLFLVITFCWHIFVANGVAFDSFIGSLDRVMQNFFTDFLNLEARSREVLSGIGLTEAVSFLHQIGRFFFYLIELLAIFGFLYCIYAVLYKPKNVRIDFEYLIFIITNISLLILVILVPNLANTFRTERFFQTVLLVAAPAVILGWNAIVCIIGKFHQSQKNKLSKLSVWLITVGILIPNFFFNIGFVYEIANDQSWSLPLSWRRLKTDISGCNVYSFIVPDQDLFGAVWLSKNIANNTLVYGDYPSIEHVLLSYGLLATWRFPALFNSTQRFDLGSLVYLRLENIVFCSGLSGGQFWNTTTLINQLAIQNQVYSNGYCQVWSIIKD
ncbi:MAG: DUF2206 domain-containing protein [Candidatus Bathyarchaeia archaeon]